MALISRAGETPFLGTTRIVSSPAMVPSTSATRRWSRAAATLLAWPGSVRIRPKLPGELQGHEPARKVLDESLVRGRRRLLRGQHIGVASVGPGGLADPQALQVPGERGLRGHEAFPPQERDQGLLAVHPSAGDDPPDGGQPLRLVPRLREPVEYLFTVTV